MEKSIPLKEIVGFLPYGLKVFLPADELTIDLKEFIFDKEYYTHERDLRFIKPIVRPLSYLTKEITHNGETFVPSELISKCSITGTTYNFHRINSENVFMLPYEIFQKLHEWHFDIYDWIKDGLAVDINSI